MYAYTTELVYIPRQVHSGVKIDPSCEFPDTTFTRVVATRDYNIPITRANARVYRVINFHQRNQTLDVRVSCKTLFIHRKAKTILSVVCGFAGTKFSAHLLSRVAKRLAKGKTDSTRKSSGTKSNGISRGERDSGETRPTIKLHRTLSNKLPTATISPLFISTGSHRSFRRTLSSKQFHA